MTSKLRLIFVDWVIELAQRIKSWILKVVYMKYNPSHYIEETDEESLAVNVRITSGQFDGALLRFYNIQLSEDTETISYNLDVLENAKKHTDMHTWALNPSVLEEGTASYDLAVASQNIMDDLLEIAVNRAT